MRPKDRCDLQNVFLGCLQQWTFDLCLATVVDCENMSTRSPKLQSDQVLEEKTNGTTN